MMYLDQKVKVDCTDHNTQNDGKIIRIYSNGIDVEVSGTIIKLIGHPKAEYRAESTV